MNLQNAMILLTIAASLAIDCAPRPPVYEEDPYWLWPIMLQYIYRSPYTGDTITLEDRADGSIEITKRRSGWTAYRALLQKCPLGFTFNADTKLCAQGQGPAVFQYCSVNSNACNASNGTLTNLGTSEAYQGCSSSTLLSLTWQVATETILVDMMHHPNRDAVFPDLQNNWYWANNTNNTTNAYIYRRTDLKESRSKSESHGVICQYAGEFY